MSKILKVIFLLENGYNISNACKKSGIFRSEFYKKIDKQQKLYVQSLKYINLEMTNSQMSRIYGYECPDYIINQKKKETMELNNEYKKIEKFLKLQHKKIRLLKEKYNDIN